jgi:tetratricopeptide (TPR) repeat protein
MTGYEQAVEAIAVFSSTIVALTGGYKIVLTLKKPSESCKDDAVPSLPLEAPTGDPDEGESLAPAPQELATASEGETTPVDAVAVREAVGQLPLSVRLMRYFLQNGDAVGLTAFGPELLATVGLTSDERARVTNMHAIGLRRTGRKAEAEDRLKEALATATTDQTRVEALSNLGNLYNGDGRFDEADACLDKALEIEPRSLPAQVNSLCTASLRGDKNACRIRARRLHNSFADARTSTSELAKLIRSEQDLRYFRTLRSFPEELPEVAKAPRRGGRKAVAATLAALVVAGGLASTVASVATYSPPQAQFVAKKGIDAGGRRPIRPNDGDDLGVPLIGRKGIDAGG